MTGPYRSILGRRVEQVIQRLRSRLYVPMEVANGPVMMCGAIVSVDVETGRATGIRRVAET